MAQEMADPKVAPLTAEQKLAVAIADVKALMLRFGTPDRAGITAEDLQPTLDFLQSLTAEGRAKALAEAKESVKAAEKALADAKLAEREASTPTEKAKAAEDVKAAEKALADAKAEREEDGGRVKAAEKALADAKAAEREAVTREAKAKAAEDVKEAEKELADAKAAERAANR